MILSEFLQEISIKGWKLWSEDGRLRYRAPNNEATSSVLEQLKEYKAEILNLLQEQPNLLQVYPLSWGQRALWFLWQLAPDSPAYNVAFNCRISSDVDVAALEKVFQVLSDRYPILRSSFPNLGTSPIQQVNPEQAVDFQQIDATNSSEEELKREVFAAYESPFDLEQGPVMRVRLFTRSLQEHILLLVIHHIVGEGWSIGILLDELKVLYPNLRTGREATLPPPVNSHQDYVRWQKTIIESAEGERLWDYWQQQLAGELPVLNLPTDRPRPSEQTYNGASYPFSLSETLSQQLKELAQFERTTLYTILLAAFQVLLHRYTEQNDILVGCPTASRYRPEFTQIVGYLVNPVVMRADLSENPSFREFLAQARHTVLGAIEHQDYPFPLIVERLQPKRDISRSPIFQACFVLQKLQQTPDVLKLYSSQVGTAVEWGGLVLKPYEMPQQEGQFDLTLEIADADAFLVGVLKYNADLFNEDAIARMTGHFQTLLEGIVTYPELPIRQLPLLSEQQKYQLLVEWNDTECEYPTDKCIHQLFEEQVEKTPLSVAVVFDTEQLTYQQLNQRANQLAHHLQSLGVKPEVLVGICVERSIEMVVGLLGILKAGGAYVPLDPTYPQERLSYMLADSGVEVLLTQQSLVESLPSHTAQMVSLDTDWGAIAQYSQKNLNVGISSDNLAYVIYTSGSTGQPKGVMNTHQGIHNRLLWMQQSYQLTSSDRVVQKTPFSFDVSVWEFFWPLLTGARIVVAIPEGHKDSSYLVNLISEQQITTIHFVPLMLQVFLQELNSQNCSCLKRVFCSGEALPFEVTQRLFSKLECELHNLYGPTEAAIDVTFWQCQPQENLQIVPIGRPINNTQIYILDEYHQPVPIGVPGELYIGGDGLARGYLNRPELTREKFIPNPFCDGKSERLYKTGDLARYLSDGNIEYLGRIDNQVKIRGFRIELGEIEAVLSAHPQIQQAVVIAREDIPGNKRLVAYVVTSDESLTINQVREFIKQKLTEYMVPSAFVILDSLPLTPNGKIDRKALPKPDGEITREHEYVAPRSPSEEIIANIFATVVSVQNVGIHDNFFTLGGHSLLATQLISRLRLAFSVEIPLRTVFESPTVNQLDQTITQLRTFEQGLTLPPIQPIETDTEQLPLSWAQERLWFLNQFEGSSATYNIPAAVRITGNLDINALQQALSEIVHRHSILRTSIQTVNGRPRQVIHPEATINININMVDLQQLLGTKRETVQKQLVLEEAITPFSLEVPPLIRCSLLQLSTTEYVLLLTIHHIVSDGWSMGVFISELSALYQAFSAGEPSPLPELPIQYADFAVWQRQWLSGEVLETQLNYWRSQLQGSPELLQLPTDRPRPVVQTYQGRSESFTLDRDLTEKLQSLSGESGTTLFMTLLAGFATLLYRYNGESDILIGSPIANRNRSEIESLIGFFVNTLVLRSSFEANPSFENLLAQVRETTLKAYEHQDVPFEQVVEALQPQRSLSHSPLFQVMFVLQNAPMGEVELPGVTLTQLDAESTIAKFDLTLTISETDQGLVGEWEYNTDLFDGSTIECMAGHFQNLLLAIVENPQQTVGELPLLSEAERHQLLVEWNDTECEYPTDKCIHQLFEEQVEKTPLSVAVVFDTEQLTYQQLNQRANQLAHHLQSLGVKPEVLVGICVERSLEMVVGLLGILKAGGAYVPLDPTYPQERLSYMLADSGVEVLLTQESLVESLPSHTAQIVSLDTDWGAIAQYSQKNLDVGVSSDNLAYVIYTSGSTGQPKGVLVEHKNVVRLFAATQSWYHFNANDVWTNFHSIAFDFSVWEIWGALLYGGRLVIVPYWISRDPKIFYDLLCSENVTVLNQTPSAFCQLISVEQSDNTQPQLSLRLVIFGGEALELQSLKPWFERHGDESPQLVNMYGITETTVHVTYRPLTIKDLNSSISVIGCPIPDLQIYILDDNLQPVPIGVKGQMYVGGYGLARGYLNRQQLTTERFISNPFNDQLKGRLYQTGDLACYLLNGDIEYLGRIDDQVKVRGFRVELGEVEAVLNKHPQLSQAVVTVQGNAANEKRLIGYVVTKQSETVTTEQLRSFLLQKLPDYMIPSAFVTLESLPLTPNQKVDRRALPTPDFEPSRSDDYVVPRNPTEEIIANIFASVLKLEQVGIYNNFFELGGHSLLATQVVSRLRSSFQVEVPLRTLFEAATVAELAQAIWALRQTTSVIVVPRIEPVSINTDFLPLSWAQERLWFLDQLESDSAAYNMPAALQISGQLNITALEQALTEIIQRHSVLRTSFATVNGTPMQAIAPPTAITIPIVDLRPATTMEQDTCVQLEATQEAQQPFDLAKGSPIRLKLLQLAEQTHVLLITLHHIVFDAWSMSIFVRELIALYEAALHQQPCVLPALPIQYTDFACWQRQWLQGEILETQLSYWKQQLSGNLPVLQLPIDYSHSPTQNYQGAQQVLRLSKSVTTAVKTLSRQEGVTVFMTLLAAFKVLLSRHTGQEDIIVGSPIAGRNHLGTEELIGCFLNTLPLRTDLSGNPSFRQLLTKVREVTLSAYSHQDIPFEKLVEELRPERSLSRHPLFDVTFNMINTPEVPLEIPGLTFEPLELTQLESKFFLTVYVQEVAEELKIIVVYRQNLFSSERMTVFLEQFEHLVQQIVVEPERSLESYSLITPQSRSLLPDPSALLDEPHYEPVTALFAAWAQQAPEQSAIRQNDQTWTYQELAQSAHTIAEVLLSCGVQPGDVVAVYGSRSFGLIASMLGVFLSGGVLLLVDSNLPTARQQLMLQEAQAKYLLNVGIGSKQAHLTESSLEIIDVEPQTATTILPKTRCCFPTLTPEDRAYIFFTSGSTGTPKGVLGTHKGISHFLDWQRQTFEIGTFDRVAQLTSLTFDAILRDVFLPLTSGATLCLPDSDNDFGSDRVLSWLEKEQITVVHTVPAIPQSWLTQVPFGIHLTKLRWIFFSGEPLTQTLVRQWRQAFPEAWQVVNLYGATETTMVKCFYPVPSEIPAGVMPGGWALPHTQALVLNKTKKLCGIGEIGEIIIRTPYRTLGYINAIAEQQQRFVPNPDGNDPEDLFYYTGDKGRYRPDGAIEVLGRNDDQIKIRGIRVQPGEIEAVLNQHPAVGASVVIATDETSGDKRLVAYVVAKPNQTFAKGEVSYFLKQQLPQYLVPSVFVVLDALPLTANGKVNRRALPTPSQEVGSSASNIKPRTPTEEVIVSIFAAVLKVQHVSVDDNFFELGGHSLLATQVISRLREALKVNLPLRTLFEAPTPAELAVAIEKIQVTRGAEIDTPKITKISRERHRVQVSSQEELTLPDAVRQEIFKPESKH